MRDDDYGARPVRVIAGIAKGRRLDAPPGSRTRPTADRVKEALFSMLAPRLAGASVADLYAGSGALGIEALSRGAEHAVFVERDPRALAALRTNLARTGLADRATVVAADVEKVLREGPPHAPFTIVLIDPPYDVEPEALGRSLATLAASLADGATVTVELGRRSPAPSWPPELLAGDPRRYGDTLLHTARRTAGAE